MTGSTGKFDTLAKQRFHYITGEFERIISLWILKRHGTQSRNPRIQGVSNNHYTKSS
jgi:hypothetical protein